MATMTIVQKVSLSLEEFLRHIRQAMEYCDTYQESITPSRIASLLEKAGITCTAEELTDALVQVNHVQHGRVTHYPGDGCDPSHFIPEDVLSMVPRPPKSMA